METLSVWMALGTVSCLFVLRAVFVLWQIRRGRRTGLSPSTSSTTNTACRTLIVLGSGGHTSEMLFMTQHLNPKRYHPIAYVKAATDATSTMRLDQYNGKSTTGVTVYDIPRSREVGQSYVSSVATTLYAAVYAFVLVARVRPNLLLCNGPGTCVPLAVAALFFRILGWTDTKVVFVESYCRVETLSLTGKLLYPWADVFVVHWPKLHRQFPHTILSNSFVQHDCR